MAGETIYIPDEMYRQYAQSGNLPAGFGNMKPESSRPAPPKRTQKNRPSGLHSTLEADVGAPVKPKPSVPQAFVNASTLPMASFEKKKTNPMPWIDAAQMAPNTFRDAVASGSLSGTLVVDSNFLKKKNKEYWHSTVETVENQIKTLEAQQEQEKNDLIEKRDRILLQVYVPDPTRSLSEEEYRETQGGAILSQRESQMYAKQLGELDQKLRNIETHGESPELTQFRQLLEIAKQQEVLHQYDWLAQMPDFEEKSRYVPTGTKENAVFNKIKQNYPKTGFEDILYDYVNGNQDAQDIMDQNDLTVAGLDSLYTETHAQYRDLPQEIVDIYNAVYKTYGSEAARTFLDGFLEKQYTGINSLVYGFMDRTGAVSFPAALIKGGATILGDEETVQRITEAQKSLQDSSAAAKSQHPIAYGIGEGIGNAQTMLLTMYGLQAIPGFQSLSPLHQNMILGAVSNGTPEAMQGLGEVTAGNMSWEEYLSTVLKATKYGAVGGAGNWALGQLENQMIRQVFQGQASYGTDDGAAQLQGGISAGTENALVPFGGAPPVGGTGYGTLPYLDFFDEALPNEGNLPSGDPNQGSREINSLFLNPQTGKFDGTYPLRSLSDLKQPSWMDRDTYLWNLGEAEGKSGLLAQSAALYQKSGTDLAAAKEIEKKYGYPVVFDAGVSGAQAVVIDPDNVMHIATHVTGGQYMKREAQAAVEQIKGSNPEVWGQEGKGIDVTGKEGYNKPSPFEDLPVDEAETPGNLEDKPIRYTIPDNPSVINHIFQPSHNMSHTPENIALLEEMANNPKYFCGKDKHGAEWYAKDLPGGKQMWTQVRGGIIFEGGINLKRLPWNPETGFKRQEPPRQRRKKEE